MGLIVITKLVFLGLYDVTNVMLKTKIKPEYLSKIECKSEVTYGDRRKY